MGIYKDKIATADREMEKFRKAEARDKAETERLQKEIEKERRRECEIGEKINEKTALYDKQFDEGKIDTSLEAEVSLLNTQKVFCGRNITRLQSKIDEITARASGYQEAISKFQRDRDLAEITLIIDLEYNPAAEKIASIKKRLLPLMRKYNATNMDPYIYTAVNRDGGVKTCVLSFEPMARIFVTGENDMRSPVSGNLHKKEYYVFHPDFDCK